jgi:hypothetical protein
MGWTAGSFGSVRPSRLIVAPDPERAVFQAGPPPHWRGAEQPRHLSRSGSVSEVPRYFRIRFWEVSRIRLVETSCQNFIFRGLASTNATVSIHMFAARGRLGVQHSAGPISPGSWAPEAAGARNQRRVVESVPGRLGREHAHEQKRMGHHMSPAVGATSRAWRKLQRL